MESNRHRLAMNVLIRSVYAILAEREDYFVGGNMFIYYSREQAKNRDFKGPNMFVALDVDGQKERQGWVVWEEDGRYPDVIIELMSPSTAQVDLTSKKAIYERTFKTSNYFVYDPFNPASLQGWYLGSHQRYEPAKKNEKGQLWCDTLSVWLGIWPGTLERETAPWLRFFDQRGILIPLPEEMAIHQAEMEKERADQAQALAQEEKERADQAQARAEQEQARADRLAEKLRNLGGDPLS